MDEQNNQGNQQITPTEVPSAYAPPEPGAPVVATAGNSKFSKKLIVIVISIVIALLLAAGLLWYFVLPNQGSSSNAANTHEDNSSDQLADVAFSQPDQLIYYRGNGKEVPRTLYSRAIGSDDETKILELPGDIASADYDVAIYHNQIAFVAAPNWETNEKTTIYFSSDSGKSYKKIYTTEVMDAAITSLAFSTDGKALIFGLLQSVGRNNQVTEVLLDGNYEPTALFTTDDAGVFLKGYDRAKKLAVYFSGCYNCDGYFMRSLYTYDLAAGKQDMIYQTDSLLLSAEINQDFSKVLALEASLGNGYYAIQAPYDLLAIDIATKKTETIKTFDDGEALNGAGYTPEGNIYVVADTRIRQLANGELTTLLNIPDGNRHARLLFAGKNGVIEKTVVSGSSETDALPTYTLLSSKAGDPAPLEIMRTNGSADETTFFLGVTRK